MKGDRPALRHRFDLALEAAAIKAAPGLHAGAKRSRAAAAGGRSIFVAVERQLGLRLEPDSAGVSVLVSTAWSARARVEADAGS